MAKERKTAAETSTIIEYTNLLHRSGGPQSKAAKKFFEQHAPADPVFRKRAEVLNRLYMLKPVP